MLEHISLMSVTVLSVGDTYVQLHMTTT